MDRDLMGRPPPERAREFRGLARAARQEANLAPVPLQESLFKIADEWEYLAKPRTKPRARRECRASVY